MSTSDGEARVVQISHRLPQAAPAYCPLQISAGDTAGAVISNAVVTLGLDGDRAYSLLEVRKSGCEEKLKLEAGDFPLERVLLWPKEAQKWHPESRGYYFILEEATNGGGRVETSEEAYADLCNLSTVTEDSILEALRQRFQKHKIYTYARNILLALNPNKFLPLYYNPKYVKMYENQPLGKLSPHIFAMADLAYRAMLNRKADQCIVMSGQSGSGKTESGGYLVHCLTALSQQTYSSGMERTVLGASPVLEAFGNAKTQENDNSSRFGKFIQLNYLESGVIRGAVIKTYLLETCRLVDRDKRERNYHVFYYLLVGASKDEQEEFHLLPPQDYLYLKQEDLHMDDEVKLGQAYKRLHQAMEMVGFLPSTKKHIFSTLSAILLLGNVSFTLSENSEALEVGPADVLSTLSDLLKVKKERLIKTLTERRASSDNGTVFSQYTLQEATSARDSMAKSLYGALFDWIVLHINHALLNRRDMEESVCCLSIGVLDLFGLENLQTNGFEQLCINYSNEKLHCYMNQQIFKLQQEDYVSEGISCHSFDYIDNSSCVQLISDGLFTVLDEESKLPQSTDGALLDKLKLQLKDNSLFAASTDCESLFVIQHFAGSVQYCIKGFRQKNMDRMQPAVARLLRSSERSFLHHLVASGPEALFRWGVLRATIRILAVFKGLGRKYAEKMAARRSSRKSLKDIKQRLSSNSWTLDFSFDRSDEHPLDVFEDIFANFEKRKKTRAGRQKQVIPKNLMDLRSLRHVVGLVSSHKSACRRVPHATPATVCAQFQASLTKLMDTLAQAEPFFIFCLRSNAEKKELHFDDELVRRQIRYTGILKMVLVQKSGYAAKYTFKEFVEKFRMLLPKEATESPEHIAELLARMGLDQSTYQIGKTKVFLKEEERQLLQDTLNKEVMRHIIVLQRWFRACLMRMHFQQKRDASLIIQRSWREFSEKRSKAASVIQTAWRTSLKRSQKLDQLTNDENSTKGQPGRVSQSRKELRRQRKVELSPNRSEQTDPVNGESAPKGNRSRERREGRGSPPTLNRPFSVPLDPKADSDDSGAGSPKPISLQRYKDGRGFKEKAERWRGRMSDESSPEVHRRKDFQRQGKSMSADELSKVSSSGSDSSPSASEIPAEPDGSRYSLPASSSNDETSLQRSNQSHLTTPEKIWFLSRFLRKRPPKLSAHSETLSQDKAVTLPRYTPQVYHMPDQRSARISRNPTIKISRATRVQQWNASLDREITDPKELRNLDEFLGNQVNDLRAKELSQTESIFLKATVHFRETIKGMFSMQKPQIGYKDLMKGYHNKVSSLAGPEKKNEASLVVNLFQSVLDGFIRGEVKRLESEPLKASKTTKKRRKKDKCPDGPLGHRFSTSQVNIMQSCDLCGSYIWGMEKAYMCSACKLICHKKCLSKIIADCSTRCALQDDSVPGALHFGVHVCVLTSKTTPVPKVVELLLLHVEVNGLYTEGLYRKSGSACRARELHQIMEMDPEAACLENYPIHTVAGLLKRWLRELPDPLMTFCLYKDFLHAVEFPERAERIRAVYQTVDELPLANYNTLERLIFHLVRVANEEDYNKMSPSSLAIVFAPCILRSPDSDDPFLGMKDVARTTTCVEILITEQFRRYKEKLQNIQELEYAEALAVSQLKLKRQNTVVEKPSELNVPDQTDNDERTLIERIRSIKQEKLDLACRLPDLEQENSDNEILDSSSSMSTESLDERLGSLDSEEPRPHGVQQPESFKASEEDATHPSAVDRNTFSGSFDNLEIPYIDEEEEEEEAS
ncbi:unconventional myosin-IXb isoform X2 [Dunckerocampus dactyliophorus]|uniref:unconventional myosin-IXb isoform X2 n=1 Tax=Dunckerocampus dactyliophorus TaxID=161453 RepID=UPI002404A7D5|nr:unconventional myosin-IXb isoform X2 [Dunckerocampus dactyliophorus]